MEFLLWGSLMAFVIWFAFFHKDPAIEAFEIAVEDIKRREREARAGAKALRKVADQLDEMAAQKPNFAAGIRMAATRVDCEADRLEREGGNAPPAQQ